MLQSSAYLQNLCPLFSSSLSTSSSIIFANNGLSGPPCGVPSSLDTLIPFIRTPLSRYFLISFRSLLSLIFFSSFPISMLWFTLSKNFSKSISTTHLYPWFIYVSDCLIAFFAPLLGLNPKLLSEKVGSYNLLSTCAMACWIILSCTVGIPSNLTPPSGFGISTLLTGDGLYFPSSSLVLTVAQVFLTCSRSSSVFMPSIP